MKIIIASSTFNRPIITGICLRNLQQVRSSQVRLVVYDDASTAYDESFLQPYADEVLRFPRNGGIERSRARAMRDFVYRFTDADLLYLTDNDTLHDPIFVQMLEQLFAMQANSQLAMQLMPVSLYHAVGHAVPDRVMMATPQFIIGRTMAGVSQCYTREMAEAITAELNRSPHLETAYGWDFRFPLVLQRPCLFTQTSYVEHFARDRAEAGMHANNSGLTAAALADFELDRAVNPSPYLVAQRDAVIRQILGWDVPSPASA